MNRFTTAAIFLLILAASVFAAGGALKPVTATEKGIETRTVTRAYQTDAAPEAATEPPESDSDQEELHTPEQAAAPPYTEETVTMFAKVVWAEARGIQSKAEQAARHLVHSEPLRRRHLRQQHRGSHNGPAPIRIQRGEPGNSRAHRACG